MHPLDLITILVFSLGILLTGLLFSRSGRSMKSFFAAGGAVPWWVNGLSLFMGFFSAGTFVVWGSIAYSHGFVSVAIQATMCIAGFLVAFFVAPRWHRKRTLTAAEYVRQRLGLPVQKLYTFLFLFISIFNSGAFLYPVAKIVEVSIGLPLQTCILILGVISILYVTIGGLWAVVVTDVLQFVILTVSVLIVIPLSFRRIGGVGNFFDNLPAGFTDLCNSEYTILFLAAFCLYNFCFLGGNWSHVQRYSTVRTPRDARRVGLVFGSLYAICPIVWMLPPMIYRVCNPDISGLADEGAYLLMCKEVLPAGMLGMMIGGMIFATASSLNGALNISAGVFTNDVVKRFFPSIGGRRLMRVARLSTIGFGLLAVLVASLIPKMGGIVNVVISLAALTGVPLYLPVIWTLFSKRQTARSVVTATVVSLLLNAFFKFMSPSLLGFSLTRGQEMAAGVLFPTVILLMFELIAFVRGYADPRHEACLLATADKAEDSQAQAASSEDNVFCVKVIGIGVMSIGLCVAALGAMAEYGTALICSAGALLVALGLLVYIKTVNKQRSI